MTLVSVNPHPVSVHPTPAGRKWMVWLLVPIVVLLALGGYWGYVKWSSRSGPALAGAKFYPVVPVEMTIKVDKDGELQAVNNIDVQCLVEGGSTIVQIVKEGAFVKKGDVLVVLDSSAIRQKIEDAQLTIQTAESDATAAKEMYDIQESQNAANLDAAKVDVELAKLSLQQYEEGTYPQMQATAQTLLEMQKINVANAEDDLRQTRELYAKNYVAIADVKKFELALTTVKNQLAEAQTAMDVLEKFTHKMELAGKRNYVAQSDQKLARTQHENASNLSKARADMEAKQQKLALLKRQFARYQEQLDNCTIKAPAEGLVVYAQQRESSAPVAEGAPVRERQVLLRLPDTTAMKAVIKVNESQVTRLVAGQRATVRVTGLPDPVPATLTKISPVADSSQRWWNPDLREYPVELTLDNTPPNLKPGIGVQSEILVESVQDALCVPLATLYAQGPESYVFVRNGEAVEPKKVTVGRSNETQVQVASGLKGGEQVLLLLPGQGRELLEKANIHLAPPEPPKGKKERKDRPDRNLAGPDAGRKPDGHDGGRDGPPAPNARPPGPKNPPGPAKVAERPGGERTRDRAATTD